MEFHLREKRTDERDAALKRDVRDLLTERLHHDAVM